MSAFDDFSHRPAYPACIQLAALLDRTDFEQAEYGRLPPLQFASLRRSYLHRGLKWTILLLTIRTALEATNADGHGNRAQRRIERLKAEREAAADAETAEWFDDNGRLLPEDVDALAELHAEARRPHYHDLPLALPYE